MSNHLAGVDTDCPRAIAMAIEAAVPGSHLTDSAGGAFSIDVTGGTFAIVGPDDEDASTAIAVVRVNRDGAEVAMRAQWAPGSAGTAGTAIGATIALLNAAAQEGVAHT